MLILEGIKKSTTQIKQINGKEKMIFYFEYYNDDYVCVLSDFTVIELFDDEIPVNSVIRIEATVDDAMRLLVHDYKQVKISKELKSEIGQVFNYKKQLYSAFPDY